MKRPVVSPSGAVPTTDQIPLILSKGKETIRAPPCKKGPDVVIVDATTVRGQKRSTSRTTGSGRVSPSTPSYVMLIFSWNVRGLNSPLKQHELVRLM